MRLLRFRELPIERKMLALTLLICGTVLVVAAAALFAFQIYTIRANLHEDTATLARIIADNSAAAASFQDPKAAREILGSLRSKPFLNSAVIALTNGLVLAQFPESSATNLPSGFPTVGGFGYVNGHLLRSEAVLDSEARQVGTLYLRTDYLSVFLRLLGLYALVMLAVVAISIALAAMLSRRLHRAITDPVLALARTAQLIAEKQDYSVRAEGDSRRDELGRLTSAFNQMLSRIEGQDAALNRSQQKLEALIHSIDGVVWERAADSCRFTFVSRQSERLLGYTPEEWMGDPMFWRAKLHPEDAARAVQTGCRAVLQREPYHCDYRMLAADGRTVWIRESGVVMVEGNESVAVRGIFQDITDQKQAAEELDKLNSQLISISHQAGRAEVATSVLHNVGNVLNSVNVSCSLVLDRVRQSKVGNLCKVAAMLDAQNGNLATFLTHDQKGRQLPAYLSSLAPVMLEDQSFTLKELTSLREKIDHIKEIVTTQQSYGRVSGVKETLSMAQVVEDAVRLNSGSLSRHGVEVKTEFEQAPLISIDKHKVLQILLNLISNAKYACDETGDESKRVTLRVYSGRADQVCVQVTDNGVGIPPENLTRIFAHGFTTRKSGHGFGLHSSALAAKELGGNLTVRSDGPGKGATFTLELPGRAETTRDGPAALTLGAGAPASGQPAPPRPNQEPKPTLNLIEDLREG